MLAPGAASRRRRASTLGSSRPIGSAPAWSGPTPVPTANRAAARAVTCAWSWPRSTTSTRASRWSQAQVDVAGRSGWRCSPIADRDRRHQLGARRDVRPRGRQTRCSTTGSSCGSPGRRRGATLRPGVVDLTWHRGAASGRSAGSYTIEGEFVDLPTDRVRRPVRRIGAPPRRRLQRTADRVHHHRPRRLHPRRVLPSARCRPPRRRRAPVGESPYQPSASRTR